MKSYEFQIDGKSYTVDIETMENTEATVVVNGRKVTVTYPERQQQAAPVVRRAATGASAAVASAPAPSGAPAATGGAGSIKSPLPGVIVDILVKEGDVVERGQCLLVLEAMKMENNILAEKSGTVQRLCVKMSESVLEGAELAVVS